MLKTENESNVAQNQAFGMLVPSHPNCSSSIKPYGYFSCTSQVYVIVDAKESEHAVVLFTKEANTSERRVMKLLLSYKDTRYSQETPKKRQQCQIEALWRNRAFSPEIYIGLAPVRKREPLSICIGEILTSPESNELEPETEYVLVMEELLEERGLTALISKLDATTLRKYLMLLTEHIANIHNQLMSTISEKNNEQWSTYGQLKRKLQLNLELLDLIPKKYKNAADYPYFQQTVSWLKVTLVTLFRQRKYRNAFEQRTVDNKIKLCHGDLKVPHIWILPYEEQADVESARYIKILDAIDFNPTFCNVDILSDFAMLVNDIQTRTGSTSLGDEMIDYYLRLTEQESDEARLILGFYLVEKAIVGAAISIVYDDLPQLGRKHLKVAQMRLQKLLKMQSSVSSSTHQLNDSQHAGVAKTKPRIKVGIQDILFACISLGRKRKLP